MTNNDLEDRSGSGFRRRFSVSRRLFRGHRLLRRRWLRRRRRLLRRHGFFRFFGRRTATKQIELERLRIALDGTKTTEQRQFEFDWYKARLDFWKFVLGSVVAAIAIALIPPLFQYGTAYLEQRKGETFLRNEVIRQFVSSAQRHRKPNSPRTLFARVADTPFREGWDEYHRNLVKTREDLQEGHEPT
ncbi:hypothetical protein [Bradyrhizobium sp. BR 1432]|uniref:hypothetical protein n=1 Tax=Bradyrhizobium sp. BR 1432 TaxID=3447966 RepID=UPI003EE68DD5